MFRNDYSEIAPMEIINAIASAAAAGEQNVGYGLDCHSLRAAELIRDFLSLPQTADVHFLAGGTQTNMTVISYLLKPYEGVIACDTGHINVHETAAVEASGHKVITCPNADGKLKAADVEDVMLRYTDEHMVKPGMIYISDATETGTVYTAEELQALRRVCDKYGLLIFLDGARFGAAVTSRGCDTTPAFIAGICDVFYIGGTKNGLMYGEAVVFPNPELGRCFRYHIKNRGAMLAKGFIPGLQFETLFTDGLFLKLAENSNRTAAMIRSALKELGIAEDGGSTTNQIFVRLPRTAADALTERFGCELWKDLGEERVVRIVTSFATTDAGCKELIEFLASLV